MKDDYLLSNTPAKSGQTFTIINKSSSLCIFAYIRHVPYGCTELYVRLSVLFSCTAHSDPNHGTLQADVTFYTAAYSDVHIPPCASPVCCSTVAGREDTEDLLDL
ncbi:hypothetical protein CBL_12462 [Carabus blaptoides fortunei]